MTDTPEFQKLLDQFKEELVFKSLISKNFLTNESEILYEIITNNGKYSILETDYLTTFDYVKKLLVNQIGGYKSFMEVKTQMDIFEKTVPYKNAMTYKKPSDWNILKKYVNEKYGSADCYFNFLVKL